MQRDEVLERLEHPCTANASQQEALFMLQFPGLGGAGILWPRET